MTTTLPFLLAQMDPEMAIGLGIVCTIAVPLLLWGWYRCTKRKRLIEDVPTSKVKGVAIGLTELKGEVLCSRPLVSFLAEKLCGWYRYEISEHYRRTTTDSKGNRKTTTGWETVDSGGRMRMFHVQDDTGMIRIKPAKAEIDGHRIFSKTCHRSDPLYYGKGPNRSVRGSTGKRQFIENAICPHDIVYVMGSAHVRDDIPAAEIAYDRDGEMYMISVRSEEEIVKGEGCQAQGMLIGGAILAFAAPLLYVGHQVPDVGSAFVRQAWVLLAVMLGYGLTATGLYSMLLYNGLVNVMTRMEKAWSLIDVQLQRRHDLIPRLVEVVKGGKQYEREVQTALAALRNQPVHTRGRPDAATIAENAAVADQQTEALGQLIAVVEAYPAIKSQPQFIALQTELADTEDRIALARSFYNDSVTAYNKRIMTMPDVLFASLGGFGPAQLYQIHDFQRRAIKVDWSVKEEAEAAQEAESEDADAARELELKRMGDADEPEDVDNPED